MTDRPAVVVVAAGKGSRFAGDLSPAGHKLAGDLSPAGHKLLQPLGHSTVLGTTLAAVVASGLPMVVVTTAAMVREATQQVAQRDVVVVGEAEAARGMGSSISTGVAARGTARGWLILPADMPLVRPETLRAVAAALADHPVAYATYRGRRGHPVGFGAELYSDLVMLGGDEGARRLVARYPAHGVEVDDPGVLTDIDTPKELEAARAQLQAMQPGSPAT